MKKFIFYLNLILTIVALIFVFIENVIGYNLDCSIEFLVILGLFQVSTSFIITIYAIANNRHLLGHYILYWFFVTLFFKFFINVFFYGCLLIAIYNLYVNYYSFSNSKFNILKR